MPSVAVHAAAQTGQLAKRTRADTENMSPVPNALSQLSFPMCREAAEREVADVKELAERRYAEAEEARQTAAEARTAERAALDAVVVAEGEAAVHIFAYSLRVKRGLLLHSIAGRRRRPCHLRCAAERRNVPLSTKFQKPDAVPACTSG